MTYNMVIPAHPDSAMTRKIRTLGLTFILFGFVLFLFYLIPPLRGLWPLFRQLPGEIQLGVGSVLFGGLIILVALIIERIDEREYDRSLRDPE